MAAMTYGFMETINGELGEKLSKLIDNQSELSRRTGIAQSSISQIMAGKRRAYFDQIVEIAKALDVSLDYLASEFTGRVNESSLSDDEKSILKTARDMKLDSSKINYLIRLGMEKQIEDAGPDIGPGLPPKPRKRKSGGKQD